MITAGFASLPCSEAEGRKRVSFGEGAVASAGEGAGERQEAEENDKELLRDEEVGLSISRPSMVPVEQPKCVAEKSPSGTCLF